MLVFLLVRVHPLFEHLQRLDRIRLPFGIGALNVLRLIVVLGVLVQNFIVLAHALPVLLLRFTQSFAFVVHAGDHLGGTGRV